MRRGDRDGSTWKVFWLGGDAGESTPDERTPSIAAAHDEPGKVLRASMWGVSAPWNLVAVAALGVWLLAAPAVFGVDILSGAADVAHIGGAFVIVAAVIALAEPVRALRLLNIPAGIALAGLGFLAGADASYAAAIVVSGAAVALLSARRGEIEESYSDWTLLTRCRTRATPDLRSSQPISNSSPPRTVARPYPRPLAAQGLRASRYPVDRYPACGGSPKPLTSYQCAGSSCRLATIAGSVSRMECCGRQPSNVWARLVSRA